MNKWLFNNADDIDSAKLAYEKLGYCGFTNLLSPIEVTALLNAVSEALDRGKVKIDETDLLANNDVIFAHGQFELFCQNPQLVDVARGLLGGCDIELQHAKLNTKPRADCAEGEVKWHQDYPFFPHTNYDLVACAIHLDDEEEESGPMEFVPGSHRLGVLSHLNSDGSFAYECTDQAAIKSEKPEKLIAKKGWVTFHHGLAIHRSAPKSVPQDRKLLVYQYRATDAVQLAGVIWRCNGYKVHPTKSNKRYARFVCGTRVELRGVDGRLYDPFAQLASNK